MRTIVCVAVAALAASLMPARAQDTCYVVECWPIPGGQRCQHRCFHPQPQYYAQPEDDDTEPVYQEPEYETPEPQSDEEPQEAEQAAPEAEVPPYDPPDYAPQPNYAHAGPVPDPAPIIALVGVIVLILLIVFGSAGTSSAGLRRRIAKAEHDATTARNLGRQAERGAQEIDAFIEHSASEHFDRGRAAGDKEWTRG